MKTKLRLVDGWVDLERGRVEREPEAARLTKREGRLLGYLAARPPTPCPTEELLKEVWGYHAQVQSRAVDAAVHRLRRKLEVDPRKPVHLVTVYGRGVYFRPAEADDAGIEPDFAGRGELLDELLQRLDAGVQVQLLGTGGVGKSRLAQEVLSRREGVFCRLDQAADVAAVERALAWTLGVDPALLDTEEGQPALAEAMASRGVVVLDGGENVEGLGPWIDGLANEAPLVVTTRRQLPGSLEVMQVQPLDLDAGVALLQSMTGLPRTADLEAVVARVGGLPLALRLVQRHLSWLQPSEVAPRALRIVAGGEGAGSLAEVVQTSLRHLEPHAREGLLLLGAFPLAPWPLDAAEAVVGSLDALRAIAEASLAELRGDGLLDMHPLIHAELSPDAAVADEARRRLLAWYEPWVRPLVREEADGQKVDVLLAVSPLLRSLPQPTPLVDYGVALAAYERGDLRRALHVLDGLDQVAAEAGLGAWAILLRSRVIRRLGNARQAAESLAEQLDACDWPVEVRSVGWQLVAASWSSMGQFKHALQAYDRATEGVRGRSRVERAVLELDRCKAMAGLGEEKAAYERALVAWGDLDGGPTTYAINGANTLGNLAMRLGRAGTARGWFELALAQADGYPERAAVVHNNLAALELARGSDGAAQRHAESALEGYRRAGRRRGMVLARLNRGRALLLAERWVEAVPELEQSRALADALGMKELAGWIASFIVIALAGAGHVDEARAQLDPSDTDSVARLAEAYVARGAGEPFVLPDEADVSAELRVHVRALLSWKPSI